MTPNHRL